MPKKKATGLPRRRSIGNNTQGPKCSPGERKLPSSAERPLLLAKLRVQHIPAALPRPALFRNLDAARRRGQVVWISDVAVKKKKIMSYLAARRLRHVWYQMDERDRDTATFFYYLREATACLRTVTAVIKMAGTCQNR